MPRASGGSAALAPSEMDLDLDLRTARSPNSKLTQLHCVKPLSQQWSVTVAMGPDTLKVPGGQEQDAWHRWEGGGLGSQVAV